MPQAVAIPAITAGAGLLGNILTKPKQPQQVSPQQQDTRAAQQGITQLAQMLQGQSQGVYNIGLPAYQRATGFYNSLMDSAPGQQRALAPALENTAAAYQGAENNLNASVARGPAQDLARTQLQLAKTGAARDLYRDAPYKAAEPLGQLGLAGLGQAGNTGGNALSGYSALLQGQLGQQQQDLKNQQFSYQKSADLGSNIGGFLSMILPLLSKSKTGLLTSGGTGTTGGTGGITLNPYLPGGSNYTGWYNPKG